MVITITGYSGTGKTTILNKLVEYLGDAVCCLPQDSYYKTLYHLPLIERAKTNFDHPEAIEFDLFTQHLKQLIDGKPVQKPIYNFATHTRKKQFETVIPKKVIAVEGLHVLNIEAIRNLSDIKIFIDTDLDLCFIRRLLRDTKKRGRSVDSVIKQYIATVKPMNEKYVLPMKKYADIILDNNSSEKVNISKIVDRITKECNL